MVKHASLGVMKDKSPIFLGPHALFEVHILRVLEAAGDHHTGTGQACEPERNVSSQNAIRYKESKGGIDVKIS